MSTATTTDRELAITRVFDAPREMVFDAWTDKEHIDKWWGPKGFTNTTHSMDVRPGGTWRFTMHGPDGTEYGNRITYVEVVRPEKLVYLHGEDTDDGANHFQGSTTFRDLNGKTELTMKLLFDTVEQLKEAVEKIGAIEGGNQTLDRLGEYLQERG